MSNAPSALITGAGRRVGLHVATELLAAGYRVLAVSRSHTDGMQALADAGAQTALLDLTDLDALLAFIGEHQAVFQGLTLLINNASDFTPTRGDAAKQAADFERFFRIHMLAPYLLNEAFHKHATGDHTAGNRASGNRASGNQDRCIINMTDIFAERPSPVFDIYCASKAGLSNLTASGAQKYAPGIRVNAIAPGPVLWAKQHKQSTKDAILRETPLQREGGAETIYGAVAYLASATYVTGVTLRVDGGRFHTYSSVLHT